MAHRLRTIYDSDQILVLKDGQVAEMGSHRELLDLDGIYAELWNGEFWSPPTFFPGTNKCTAQEVSLTQESDET